MPDGFELDSVIALISSQESLDQELLRFVVTQICSLGLVEDTFLFPPSLPFFQGEGSFQLEESGGEEYLMRSKIVPRLRLFLRYGLSELRRYSQDGLAFLRGRLVECTLLDYLHPTDEVRDGGFNLRLRAIYPAPLFDFGLSLLDPPVLTAFIPDSELASSDFRWLNPLKNPDFRPPSSSSLIVYAEVLGLASDRMLSSDVGGVVGECLLVSRKGSSLVKSLLALKIPAIAEGKVEIKQVVREAGYRSLVGVAPVAGGGALAFEEAAEEVAVQCATVWAAAFASSGLGLWQERVEIVGWNIYQPELMFSQLFSSLGVEFKSLSLDRQRRIVRVVLSDTPSQPKPKQIGKLVGKGGVNLRLLKAFSGWSFVF